MCIRSKSCPHGWHCSPTTEISRLVALSCSLSGFREEFFIRMIAKKSLQSLKITVTRIWKIENCNQFHPIPTLNSLQQKGRERESSSSPAPKGMARVVFRIFSGLSNSYYQVPSNLGNVHRSPSATGCSNSRTLHALCIMENSFSAANEFSSFGVQNGRPHWVQPVYDLPLFKCRD